MKKLYPPTEKTILQSLIILATIAIALGLYVRYGKPFVQQLAIERQDRIRIAALDTLDALIQSAASDAETQSMGEQNTIYVSLPADDPACANLDLPSVPEGWRYHCANAADLQKTDGTGWLPVNLAGKTEQLPTDPTNKAETLNYYAYVTGENKGYVLAGVLDSKKYLEEKAQNDGGVDDIRYEIGNRLNFWANAEGLIGYWLDNSEKSSAPIILDTEALNEIGKLNTSYTISACFKTSISQDQSIVEKWNGGINPYPFALRGPLPGITFKIYDGRNNPTASSGVGYNDNEWHCIISTRDSKNKILSLYIDGKIKSKIEDTTVSDVSNDSTIFIGDRNITQPKKFNGQLKNIKIYNTLLKEKALQIY